MIFMKMMKIKYMAFLAATVLIFLTSTQLNAQKFVTKNGHIKFYSETPIETIEAHNRQVNTALDATTGDFVFKVLMKSFEFKKALMQEHFNENYVESDKYPNATFIGKVVNISQIDFTKEGAYDALVEGDLTIHGETQKISEKGTFTVMPGDKLHGMCKFNVRVADYKIKIPGAVMQNISEILEVTVDVELTKLQ